MKKIALLLVFWICQISYAQIVDIPDPNFKAGLIEEGVDTNGDGEIQVSEAEEVLYLHLPYRNIESIEGILSFTNIITLNLRNNNLTSLELHDLPQLYSLGLDENQLDNIVLYDLPLLRNLWVESNNLTSLDLTGLDNLLIVECHRNQLTSLTLPTSSDIYELDCSSNNLTELDLTNLQNLFDLNCNFNSLTTLHLPNPTNLRRLSALSNNFTSFNVSNQPLLNTLGLAKNDLVSVELPNPSNLTTLSLSENDLTSVDLSNQTNLHVLNLNDNNISSVDFTIFTSLRELHINNNSFTDLDLSNSPDLRILWSSGNNFTSLDLSTSTNLIALVLGDSPLTSLNIKNGSIEDLSVSEVPNLEFICVDSNQIGAIEHIMSQAGYTNCVVNPFCSFIPGGEVYFIEGNIRTDINNDGCDSDDVVFQYMQLKVTSSSGDSEIYSVDSEGNYSIAVPAGSYSIEYISPYLIHFDGDPDGFSVDFPSDASPFVQDICLTPNGVYDDLQISIIPLEEARPGFDTDYRIVYANVGNTVLSGDVTFNYLDDLMDLASTSVTPDEQNTGELVWNFTDLNPLEVRTIDITMNLNPPTATPPLNGDDILCFEAYISPDTSDQTPNNNAFSLKQTVVNSYDPNDKTCLEGDVITPDLIGEYVHYLIRFENTGTASAINVVIKDVIDSNQFDMSSFTPINASHDFVTQIDNNNEVLFIFEGIELPFDDANNDGFVLFKIKTLPTLELGDTFENGAEIYFDFNFPIITNVAQTTIDLPASTEDIGFKANVNIYPNPANDILTIESQQTFDTLIIHDLTGKEIQRIVSTESRLEQQLEVSNLQSGIYYLTIQSGKAKTTKKFLKL